ncbi:MAG: response regulator transcription factor, partial [Dermatophilaceae bacterium]
QRERQVLAAMGTGLRNVEMASRLGVSEKTVKNHVNRIYTKLKVRNRVQAVLVWQAAQRAELTQRAELAQAG